MSDVNWTDEQKNRVTQAIEAESENSRLAHKLIPEFKLSPNDRAVAWDRYIYPNPARGLVALRIFGESPRDTIEAPRTFSPPSASPRPSAIDYESGP